MRRAEKVRMAMAQELTQIVRHAPAGFARVALDGRFLWANTRLCDLLGAEPVQTLSLNFRDVMIAQDPDWAALQLQRLLAARSTTMWASATACGWTTAAGCPCCAP